MKVEIVVGANYGDEGKGLFTDFLCRKSSNALVMLSNGGCQRGHTVNTRKYGRKVFQHYGSGTFQNAPTYFTQDFLLNPMQWVREHDELTRIMGQVPECSYSPDCMFQIPSDIFMNRIFEDLRGDKRHGSVGCGIFETIRRYRANFPESKKFYDFLRLSFKEKKEYVKEFQETYVKGQISDFAWNELKISLEDVEVFVKKQMHDTELGKIFFSDGMIEHFCRDCEFMGEKCQSIYDWIIADRYDTLIYEQGQGLLLDPMMRRKEDVDDTTPSHPGTYQIKQDLINFEWNGVEISSVTVNYITRTYLTKHGAGNFLADPTMHFEDKTNMPNPYQGTMRFAKLNYEDLFERINVDFSRFTSYSLISKRQIEKNIVYTHTNEVPVSEYYKASGKYFFDTDISEDLA